MILKKLGLYRDRILNYMRIPEYIRNEFIADTVRKNDFSLLIVCVIIIFVELYNIWRVLVWSSTALGSMNNRIYFSFYCTLLALGVLWLLVRRALRRSSDLHLQAGEYVAAGLFFLWHMGLNTYDLIRDPGAGTAVLTTALLGRALLIQVPPWYALGQYLVDYALLWLVMSPVLDAGDRVNLTITFIVAFAMTLVHSHYAAINLKQKKKITQMNEKLKELLQADPLTGLLNKTATELRVNELLQEGGSGEATLFLLDLDSFKSVNDRYGHPCGDHVLVETAEAIRSVFAEAAGVGRMGGDEFAVFFDRRVSEKQAAELSGALSARLAEISWDGRAIGVSCSVGACGCASSGMTYDRLYGETDRLLYEAKGSGKGQCCARQLA